MPPKVEKARPVSKAEKNKPKTKAELKEKKAAKAEKVLIIFQSPFNLTFKKKAEKAGGLLRS
jgi:hypothetical protein